MKLPSSSSLLLASLAVSSSSSSLSALAAPTGDGLESSSLPAPAPVPLPPASIPHGSDDTKVQPLADDYLRAANIVDNLVRPLLPPDLGNLILGAVHGILDPIIGKDSVAPKARVAPFDVVKQLVPSQAGKTLRAEEADGRGEHAVSEDSSMQPFAPQPGASAPPAAGHRDAPVPSHPSAGFPSLPTPQSGPVRRQAGSGGSEGGSGSSPAPVPHPPTPPPPSQSSPGGHGGDSSGANENGRG